MDNPDNKYNFDREELQVLEAFENGLLNGPPPSEIMRLAARDTLKKNEWYLIPQGKPWT